MEGLTVFLVAGFVAGAGFGLAVVTPGGFRNVAFLIGGIVFGAHFGHLNLADVSREAQMAPLCAALVGIVLVTCPYILIQEKKAEDEARRKRTTQDEHTVSRLNKLFRSPPAEK